MKSLYDWPVLTRYDRDHLDRIALHLGGIGTGTISLGGRGNLQDWEIMNRPAKGFTPAHCFFAIRTQARDQQAVTRVLEGPLPVESYEGRRGATAPNHGLPRFRECAFHAAYPFGQVLLTDPGVPVSVRLQAFNPLIPGDAHQSGLPFVSLRFLVTNLHDEPLQVAICGCLRNFIGYDGYEGLAQKNINKFHQAEGMRGLFLSSSEADCKAPQWGSMAIATTANNATYRTAWPNLSWGDGLLDFWDDFSSDGQVEEREANGEVEPIASLSTSLQLAPGATESLQFLLTWHFPNRVTWTPRAIESNGDTAETEIIGNYYTCAYRDAWHVMEQTVPELPRLENDTLQFVNAFCQSDLPDVVKEAALFNVSTLRSQTCFRTPDGNFYGWEGCDDHEGSCPGSCTHVWNYEQATAFLFSDLARSMREIEFLYSTGENGLMSFRVHLPLERAQEFGKAAADGQMGCLMKLYRDWQLCGDDEFLRALWPHAKKALEFCWIPGGWDADRDGVMEGCQHNTMDVEYFGPNPQMGTWYLGALRAAEEMANYLGEDQFAAQSRQAYENGRHWIDGNLFNGEYYEHQIRPVPNEEDIAPGLYLNIASINLLEPQMQLGAGCLIDQLVGQYMAHVCGLGYLLDPAHVVTTLHSILRYNFKENLWEHFNHLRSYALQDEAATLMGSYPQGRRPKRPFPYTNEVMTGFEYTLAAHMLYEDMLGDGIRLIAAIRERYDGRKRSPFNEAECGHHYARAMASWTALLALTGFEYSAVTRVLKFAAARQPTQWFWSNGSAWGTVTQQPEKGLIAVELEVLHSAINVERLELRGAGAVDLTGSCRIEKGEVARWRVPASQSV